MSAIDDLNRRIDALDIAHTKRLVELQEEWAAEIDALKAEAFPGADLGEHFDVHHRQIEREKEWADNWRGLRKKLFEGGGYALIVFVLGAIAMAIKSWVTK